MLGRRKGDFNPKRFWAWFASEAHGLANGLEALARGEADAAWLLDSLGERIRRYDPALDADLRRTLDGQHLLVLSGHNPASMMALLHAAPRIAGWRFIAEQAATDIRRVPFRIAPRPTIDAPWTETADYPADAFAV